MATERQLKQELVACVKDLLGAMFEDPPDEIDIDDLRRGCSINPVGPDALRMRRICVGDHVRFFYAGAERHGIVVGNNDDADGGDNDDPSSILLPFSDGGYGEVPFSTLPDLCLVLTTEKAEWKPDLQEASKRARRIRSEGYPRHSSAWSDESFAVYCQTGHYISPYALAKQSAS